VRSGQPLVLVSEVAAMAAGQVNAPGWEAEAERIAADIAVERDWAGRPVVTWTVAAQLLARMKAARTRLDQERAHREQVAMAEATGMGRFLGVGGVVQIERPGEPAISAPGIVVRDTGTALVSRP
jgi:hypothetical protein